MEKWYIYTKKADFSDIGRQFNIEPVTARVITNRNISDNEMLQEYLNGDLLDMHSPWLLKDMDRAVDIISINIQQGSRIRIVTDYDIDGICSGYILKQAILYLGGNVDVVIPDRMTDGYGINNEIIDKAYKDGVDTIITCDNGIAAIEQTEYAKTLGINFVITDHHEVSYEENEAGYKVYNIPNADAIIDPKQEDCSYPFKDLCGAAVVYKLICALYENFNISTRKADIFIEYVAIATIGDVVDLQGENRIIAKCGLKKLRKTNNEGLKALFNECKIAPKNLMAYHIGFIVGPCINASGRLQTAMKSLELLEAKSSSVAMHLAKLLKELNDTRKEMTEKFADEAMKIAENMHDKVLVIYIPQCHESLAGIIAGRLKEHFNKPAIVLTKTKKTIKGSGRSIETWNMYEGLVKCKKLLERFGGHAMAAGLSLKEENIDDFRKLINDTTSLTDDDLYRKVWIDSTLPFEYITERLIADLKKLEPFGKGNEKPLFAEKGIKIKKLSILGKSGNVIRLDLVNCREYHMPGYVFFETGEFLSYLTNTFGSDEIRKAQSGIENSICIDIVFYPDINVYNGKSDIRVVIKHYRENV
ncbi:MAG: single-stranded-DNA-specific exonuclease RecJ [Eubacterium sp.]